jgi:ankyrin repeat protein
MAATPLIEAVLAGDRQLIETLLKEGADVHARYKHGDEVIFDAVTAAVCYADIPCMRLLVRAGANINPALVVAADYCILEMVQYLLIAGANVHADGEVALRAGVCSNGRNVAAVIEALLDAGANTKRALSVAKKQNEDYVIQRLELLMRRGAPFNGNE